MRYQCPPQPRLPYAPLEPYLLAFSEEGDEFYRLRRGRSHGARMLGFHPRQADRWRAEGLTEQAADRVATALGLHPSAIWGDLWWELAEVDA